MGLVNRIKEDMGRFDQGQNVEVFLANPMSMMCLAAARTSSVEVVGLCHSVQATSRILAARAGVAWRDLTWECAGVNHLSWFTRLEHDGVDLYPQLMERARGDLAGSPSADWDAGDLAPFHGWNKRTGQKPAAV